MNQGRLCEPTTSLTGRQSRVGVTMKVEGTGKEGGWPGSRGFHSSSLPPCLGKSRLGNLEASVGEILQKL